MHFVVLLALGFTSLASASHESAGAAMGNAIKQVVMEYGKSGADISAEEALDYLKNNAETRDTTEVVRRVGEISGEAALGEASDMIENTQQGMELAAIKDILRELTTAQLETLINDSIDLSRNHQISCGTGSVNGLMAYIFEKAARDKGFWLRILDNLKERTEFRLEKAKSNLEVISSLRKRAEAANAKKEATTCSN